MILDTCWNSVNYKPKISSQFLYEMVLVDMMSSCRYQAEFSVFPTIIRTLCINPCKTGNEIGGVQSESNV